PVACCCLAPYLTAAAPTSISLLSLHDALPILLHVNRVAPTPVEGRCESSPEMLHHGAKYPCICSDFALTRRVHYVYTEIGHDVRSEEHTSELQSREKLVCRLLLEQKKINKTRE